MELPLCHRCRKLVDKVVVESNPTGLVKMEVFCHGEREAATFDIYERYIANESKVECFLGEAPIPNIRRIPILGP